MAEKFTKKLVGIKNLFESNLLSLNEEEEVKEPSEETEVPEEETTEDEAEKVSQEKEKEKEVKQFLNKEEVKEGETTEFLGSKGKDEFYYLKKIFNAEGELVDLQIMNASDEVVLSAKEENLDPSDVQSFIAKGVVETGMTMVSFDILDKYFLQPEEEKEKEEEEEEKEEAPQEVQTPQEFQTPIEKSALPPIDSSGI